MPGNLFELIRDASSSAERRAIRTPDGVVFSYADLISWSAKLAGALTAVGVRPGDRVAVQVEKSAQAILLYLACLRAGAVYLPLNTAYTLTELDYFLGDAEPSLVVCDPGRREGMKALAGKIGAAVETLGADGRGTLMDRAAAASADFADVPRTPEDMAAILYTSGTTGRSKGAMLSHRALASNALTLKDAWRFTGDDVLLHALPIFHIHGLFVATNITLVSGASMILLPKFEPKAVLRWLPEASVMMGVPTFYTRLLHEPGLAEAARGLRLFVSGSAPLLAETHRQWEQLTGHAILERYGMSETNMNTSNPYDGPRTPGSVGPPLAGVEVRITEPETGAPLADGEIGMIEVRGLNVFSGYWRMPEKTAAEFRSDGFFITGDLGVIDEKGYVSIVGRSKDLVISGGYNVYPKEVEDEIDALPGVTESAVVGLPHPDLGEGVTAVVVAVAGAALTEAEVLAALKDRLAGYKRPKRVLFVEELPRNTMGKVQKAELRARLTGLYD
ncbi:MAG: malonyl-CoA synthase [Caulobacteraceae bacterium]